MQNLSAMEKMYLNRFTKLYGAGTSEELYHKAEQAEKAIIALRPYAPQYQEQFNKNYYDLTSLANYCGIMAIQEQAETCLLLSANPHPHTNAVLSINPKIIEEVHSSGIPYITLYFNQDNEEKVFVAVVRIAHDDPRVNDIKKFIQRYHCSVRVTSAHWFKPQN